MNLNIRSISAVGVGLVGASWAAFFASHGLKVRLFDQRRESSLAGHRKAVQQLEFLRKKGLTSADLPDNDTLLTVADSLEDCVTNADLVVESASERYEVKSPLFASLDRLTRPDCILTTSSSGLLMTRIQAGLKHPERTLVAHPFNPVHLVPLVELVGGDKTDPKLIEQMQVFYEQLGKAAVIVRKEVPGYIGNRLQAAVWREAINLVLSGVGTVEDIDRALSAGPGLRWALMGQHLIFHLGGGQGGLPHFLAHIGEKFQHLWDDMDDWTAIPDEAKSPLIEGVLAEARGQSIDEMEKWRDDRLAGIRSLLQSPQ